MQIAQLNNQVSASGQLCVGDIAGLVEQGVQLLVCNRPDDEDEGQPCCKEIQDAAEQQGLEFRMLAFSSYQIKDSDRDELIKLLELGKKTHLYCRSGSRSRRLWIAANKIGCGGHDFEQ